MGAIIISNRSNLFLRLLLPQNEEKIIFFYIHSLSKVHLFGACRAKLHGKAFNASFYFNGTARFYKCKQLLEYQKFIAA